jgi:hypothetical protein
MGAAIVVPGRTAGLPQLGLLVIVGAGVDGRVLAADCTADESG